MRVSMVASIETQRRTHLPENRLSPPSRRLKMGFVRRTSAIPRMQTTGTGKPWCPAADCATISALRSRHRPQPPMISAPSYPDLASFRAFRDRLALSWPTFQQQRRERLRQEERNGTASEKVAEDILQDFFTVALDWTVGDLNHQLHYADIVLTNRGIKRLLVEAKRPGSLKLDQPSLDRALEQAHRYAAEQRVRSIAVSDGLLFYAADIVNGGLARRSILRLDVPAHSLDAWWVSVDGIYREPSPLESSPHLAAPAPDADGVPAPIVPDDVLLHQKYKIPARCFAYVGDASKPATWKLPCRLADGSVDEGRLSGAIRALISNFRGAHVTIPESAVGDVAVRLGKAAAEVGKMPGQIGAPAQTYRDLYDTLHQLDRLRDVFP